MGIVAIAFSVLASPAQALDFTLTTSGPHHVVQGHYLFFNVTGEVTSVIEDDESATPAVSGLPPGAAASFPNQTRFCCGTSVWVITGDNPVKITTSANTPPGTYPLTIQKLYKCRWQVELFFKWIKQYLHIKSFYGISENAVSSTTSQLHDCSKQLSFNDI